MESEINDYQEDSLDRIFDKFNIAEKQPDAVPRSPFKFLDSYSLEDKDIFFGRDKEVEEIYRKFYQHKTLLVYGQSGTGKSSIVNCGLLSNIPSSDIYPINIRCGKEPVNQLFREIHNQLKSEYSVLTGSIEFIKKIFVLDSNDLIKDLEKIYLFHFKPIVLFFDQFEEIFIFSNKEERLKFAEVVQSILRSRFNISVVFIIREEYYACLSEIETVIPDIYFNRIRIEKIDSLNARKIIHNPCEVCKIKIQEGVADYLINQLIKSDGSLELTYIQIIMDKLYQSAIVSDKDNIIITVDSLKQMKNLDNILSVFLNDQINVMVNPLEGEIFLKALISPDGTKALLTLNEIKSQLANSTIQFEENRINEILQHFITVRIIKEKDDQDRFELKHDSLALAIFNRMSTFEKDFLEIKQMFDNRYRDYLKKNILLDSITLENVIPFRLRLNLNRDQEKFIYRSQLQIEKIREEDEKKTRKIEEYKNLKKVKNLEKIIEERTHELVQQRNELGDINIRLNDINKEIEDSIRYASRIQNALLPSQSELESILKNGFILNMPMQIVSGDFCWMKKAGDKIYLAVADCTGHGVPGAIMSILGISSLHTIIEQNGDLSETDYILNYLSSKIKNMLNRAKPDYPVKDGMDIGLLMINNTASKAQFSGAFLPLILIRNNELIEFIPDRKPIGWHEDKNFLFKRYDISLVPGDTFYLYTDGYTDQFGGASGRKFLNKRFKNLLLEINNQPMDLQKQTLEKEFYKWKGDYSQIDDLLIVGFKI